MDFFRPAWASGNECVRSKRNVDRPKNRGGRIARTNVAIAGENHLREALVGICPDEVTDGRIPSRIRRARGSFHSFLKVGGGRAGIAGTNYHFGCAQFVGEDLEESESVAIGSACCGGGVDVFKCAAIVRADSGRVTIAIIIGEQARGQADLLEVVRATDFLRLGFGSGERGQKHAGQDRDDGNND